MATICTINFSSRIAYHFSLTMVLTINSDFPGQHCAVGFCKGDEVETDYLCGRFGAFTLVTVKCTASIFSA
jgi:hypothetical protein